MADLITAVMFDFGGVLAEEGFKKGLKAIGRERGLNPDDFFATANELIYQTGYVIGLSNESHFWSTLREKTGIHGRDEELRNEILGGFILRPGMLKLVDRIKSNGFITAILSDQTNWLDEIDQKTPFSSHFDYIFNSFRLGKSKRDPSIFRDVCAKIGLTPGEVLFVDDNSENLVRASNAGLWVNLFKDIHDFEKEISKFIGKEIDV